MKIVQVGAYPPPYGGVTVHLMRLHEHLLRAGHDSVILDVSGVSKSAAGVVSVPWSDAPGYLEALPRSVVHFHNFAPGHAAAYRDLAPRHATVLSLHNERFAGELAALDPVRRILAVRRLRAVPVIVVDSEHCRDLAEPIWGHGSEIHVIPEFIPPSAVPELAQRDALDVRARCRYLLASNAWRIETHRGEDLYGLDLMIETTRRLFHDRGLDVGLVLLLPGTREDSELAPLREQIASAGLDARVVLVTEPIPEASSLWKEADVVLRATNTDGNSLTVLEALAVGTPVIASDCVPRPAGTILFRTRDRDDLTARVEGALTDLDAARQTVRASNTTGNAEAFVALYASLQGRIERDDA